MDVKLLCLCLLLVLMCPGRAKKLRCPTSTSSCDKCIQHGPHCAWCTVPHSNVRCHTLKGLRRAECPEQNVYNPQGGVRVVKNDSRTEMVNPKAPFLQPQEISLHLRPGVSQSFPLTIATPTDRPLTEMDIDVSGVPAGVNITFTGIENGNPAVVQVNVEAARCPGAKEMQNRTGPWSVHITPRGFSPSVKLDVTLECQCACTRNRYENNPGCGGHGALVCGQCECYKPYVGRQCQTDPDAHLSPSENTCRREPDDPLCSGRGKCVEGDCECERRADPKERYSGPFCECSNFECPTDYKDRFCAGHGKCECGECLCDVGWTGEDCSCTTDTASCMTYNQALCNSRGTCQCGKCVCDSYYYAGATCEHCPTCPGVCERHVECVECLAFGTGAKKDRCDQECGYLNVTMVENKEDITGPLCRMRSSDFCVLYYSFSTTPSGGQSTVLRAKECYTGFY